MYAYDFSEYETPLVGQGMLSWILASASTTPSAPAEESSSMVTGRVCKNILGLFGNGMKETLEVKLKLVPVPTSMQHEYVENLERYHNLSQMMPEGFDYNAWSDFLKENPTLSQLAQPMPMMPTQQSQRSSFGGYEPFHDMLTRNSPSQEPMRTDSFYDQANMSFNTQPSRGSSPAMSNLSFQHYQYNPDSRPTSRASVRSESVYQSQQFQSPQFPIEDPFIMELQEDGPPKKRARITQTKRPKKTPLTAHNDSLRVTASTAASVRLHRPLAPNSTTSLASAESIPRAPTPRPGDMAFGSRGPRRPPAPSALRHASIDDSNPYKSPYESSAFSDNAADSPEEARGESPSETPTEMPSSPPLAPQRTVSPDPSSPALPTLPLPNDSGFVSDTGIGLGENGIDPGSNIWDGSDLPSAPDARGPRRAPDRSHRDWQHSKPGPMDRLPQSYVPKPKQQTHAPQGRNNGVTKSIEQQPEKAMNTTTRPQRNGNDDLTADNVDPSLESTQQQRDRNMSQSVGSSAVSPDAGVSHVSPVSESDVPTYSRSCTPNLPTQKSKTSRGKGLTRSQTWSGAGEPTSDAPTPSDPANPRSGQGAKRQKLYIKQKLERAIAAGELPEHCKNCGEIDTPTWRNVYTRIEYGTPDGLQTSTDTTSTDIISFEVIEPTVETGLVESYRIFKNKLTREEQGAKWFETLTLCNPCGLWWLKKFTMRPRRIWDKMKEKSTKRKRQPAASRKKSVTQGDDLVSDAAVPHSEPIMSEQHAQSIANLDGHLESSMPPPPISLGRASTHTGAITLSGHDAEDALRRAIQSSPAGLRGSRHSPIDIDSDLTPKPTRRLLFPSPRGQGENKSLSPNPLASAAMVDDADQDLVPENPRCQRCKRMHRTCDREHPCNRCKNSGLGVDECIYQVPRTNWFEQPVVQMATMDEENADKENCPPAQEYDALAHLFEDPVSPKSTPRQDAHFQDLLKTPTPGSRRRNILTPKRGTDDNDLLKTPTRRTSSRNILTPRGTRAATVGPETPFTRQLNALLSDSNNAPDIDFSNFPTFTTPGHAQFSDFLTDDFLSSDMPLSSSPPKLGAGFELYEDPSTATNGGLWSGVGSAFNSDTLMTEFDKVGSIDVGESVEASTMLKMNVGGVTMDFSAMIEDVASNTNGEEEVSEVAKSLEPEERAKISEPEESVGSLQPEKRAKSLQPEVKAKSLFPEPRAKSLQPEARAKSLELEQRVMSCEPEIMVKLEELEEQSLAETPEVPI